MEHTMKAAEYNQLKKQIEEQYRKAIALAEKERLDGLAAVDTVWNILHIPRQKHNKESVLSHSPETSENNTYIITEVPHVKYGTLIETIKKSILLVPPEKFTCKNVVNAMEKVSGRKFNYSSVANSLKRMVKENILTITKQGHGKVPTIYRVKSQEKEKGS
jgi:hypothetical protein